MDGAPVANRRPDLPSRPCCPRNHRRHGAATNRTRWLIPRYLANTAAMTYQGPRSPQHKEPSLTPAARLRAALREPGMTIAPGA
jgi:hypothetical protein